MSSPDLTLEILLKEDFGFDVPEMPEVAQEDVERVDDTFRSKYLRYPLSILLPIDPVSLREAQVLTDTRNLQVEHLVQVICRDPVFMLEIIRTANAMMYRQSKQAITTPRSAVIRLGASILQELFNNLASRENLLEPIIVPTFEELKTKSIKKAYVARAIARVLDPSVSKELFVCGMMCELGHLVVSAILGERYVKLAEKSRTIPVLNHKLVSEFNLSPPEIKRDYLRRFGFPRELMFAVDPETAPPPSGKLLTRFILQAAEEVVENFETEKWKKYGLRDNLPRSSVFRLIKLNDVRYERVINACKEALTEKPKDEDLSLEDAIESDSESIDAQIIIDELDEGEGNEEADEDSSILSPYTFELEEEKRQLMREAKISSGTKEKNSEPRTTKGSIPSDSELYDLKKPKQQTDEEEHYSNEASSPRIGLYSQKLDDMLRKLKVIECRPGLEERFLRGCVKLLANDGLFSRAAILAVMDKSYALPVIDYGNAFEERKLELTIESSPFLLNRIVFIAHRGAKRVDSFNNAQCFALAPIAELKLDHLNPPMLQRENASASSFLLYADCQEETAMPFASRKLFRAFMEEINKKLSGN